MKGFCGEGCRQAWRSDRSHAVVYPAVIVDGARVPWLDWHRLNGLCAYCGQELDRVRARRAQAHRRARSRGRASAPPRGDGSIAALVAQARAGELQGRVIA
jgi:hypothetical protein